MSGLVNATLLASAISLIAGLLIWGVLSRFALRPRDVLTWQAARWAVLAPIIAAPLFYFWPTPERLDAIPSPDSHAALPAPTLGLVPSGNMPSTGIVFETSWLVTAYLVGLGFAAALALLRHYRRQNLLRDSRTPGPRERQILSGLGYTETPPVRISQRITSPLLTGWNGIVLVPEDLFQQPAMLRFAWLHEQAHYERGDERDRLVGSALKTVFWFHLPLRWIERELDAARELACDAQVLDMLGSRQRKAYAAALIHTMRLAMPAASAFGPQDRRHRSMRISAIFNASGPSRLRALCLASATAAILCPLAVAQAAWTDRYTPLPRVEQVEPISPPQPEAEPSPLAAPRPDALSFGAPLPAPEPRAAAIPEPTEVSFGAPDAPAPFVRGPVTGGRLTSSYGPRPARPADAPRFHGGTDIAAEPGTPILAPADGHVVHAGYGFDGNDAWGNTVAIDHGNGWQTVYAHMQGFDVEAGQAVVAGTQIGRVGSTGRSTGPHVHVEVRRNGERVDPETHLPGLR
jgi:murein DD-endopeptidase MepM/ murein hydrolase activator NlpD